MYNWYEDQLDLLHEFSIPNILMMAFSQKGLSSAIQNILKALPNQYKSR